jgi:uncharacterized delta-60 repeat protein
MRAWLIVVLASSIAACGGGGGSGSPTGVSNTPPTQPIPDPNPNPNPNPNPPPVPDPTPTPTPDPTPTPTPDPTPEPTPDPDPEPGPQPEPTNPNPAVMSEANVQTFVSHSLLSTLLSAAAEAVTHTRLGAATPGTYALGQQGCVSGWAAFAVTIANPDQTLPGSFTAYDNCAGFVVDGTFAGAGSYFPYRADERLNPVRLDITSESLRFTRQSDGVAFKLRGRVRFDKVPVISSALSGLPGYEVTFNAAILDAHDAELFQLDQFRVGADVLSASSQNVRFEGRIVHRTLGHVDLASVSPLRYQYSSTVPSSGKFEMQGAAELAKVDLSSGSIQSSLESIPNFGSALDPTFGTAGIVRGPSFSSGGSLAAVASYSNGRLVAVGSAGSQGYIKRWNLDGSLDGTFDPAWLQAQFAASGMRAVAVTPDEKIVVATTTDDGFKMARANADGSADTSFGVGGVVTTSFAAVWRNNFALNVLPGGQVLLTATLDDSTSHGEYLLARYDATGALDTSFGNNGISRFDGESDTTVRALVQADGKILLATGMFPPVGGEMVVQLLRLDDHGALDPSFGTGGRVQTKIDDAHTIFRDATLLPDGRIIALADVNSSYLKVVPTLVRYLADGTVDTTFADAGYSRHPLDMYTGGVAVQPDGKLLIGGRTEYGLYGALAALRLTSNGVLDSSFGVNGLVRTAVPHLSELISAVLMLPSGKLVLGATTQSELVLVQHQP